MKRAIRQPTNGSRPTHSGTQGESEPCVQRESSGRAVIVIVIEQRKRADNRKEEGRQERERLPETLTCVHSALFPVQERTAHAHTAQHDSTTSPRNTTQQHATTHNNTLHTSHIAIVIEKRDKDEKRERAREISRRFNTSTRFDMRVVMQRKVPRSQTVLKTLEIPPAQLVGRVVKMHVIMQMRQWRRRSASRCALGWEELEFPRAIREDLRWCIAPRNSCVTGLREMNGFL